MKSRASNELGIMVLGLALIAVPAASSCSATRDDAAAVEAIAQQAEEQTGVVGVLDPVLLGPTAAGCADGTAEQVFAGGIVGCAGSVTFPKRATLCAAGYHPLNAMTWHTARGTTVPTHHYWTNDVLSYTGLGTGNCAAEYTRGTACPADQPMHVCASTTTDPEGNRCNWFNCSFDSNGTTPNHYFGGCAGNSTAGTLCVPDSGCVDGSVEQTFTRGMVGCAGSVTLANAASLCTAGYTLAYDSDWIRYRAGAAPTHNYWTATPPQHYSGTPSACVATHNAADPTCPADTPMRVCVPGGTDPEGNRCNWSNCDHTTLDPMQNAHFGGCVGNTTAGALCVPSRGCADGTIDQQWSRFFIGCAGSVSFADRESLCGPRELAVTATQWVNVRAGLAPTHNYWTRDQLLYSGLGSGNCAVSTASGFSCGADQAMHICTSTGSDPEGNTCNWTRCGLNTTSPNQFFGGCGPTAGVVCMTGP
jgi:hypothetical protein